MQKYAEADGEFSVRTHVAHLVGKAARHQRQIIVREVEQCCFPPQNLVVGREFVLPQLLVSGHSGRAEVACRDLLGGDLCGEDGGFQCEVRAAFEKRRCEACSVSDQHQSIIVGDFVGAGDRDGASEGRVALLLPLWRNLFKPLEMGDFDEFVEGLFGPRFVFCDKADIGSAVAFGNHPEVALLGVLRPDVEVEVAVIRNFEHLVLHACDDLRAWVEVEHLVADPSDARSVDYDFGEDWKLLALALAQPASETVPIELLLHVSEFVREVEGGSCCYRFIGDPALEEMLLEDIALLAQALGGAVGENDADALDPHRDDVLWQAQVEIVTSDIRDAFSAVNRCSDRRMILDENRRKAVASAVQCGISATRTCAYPQHVACRDIFAHGQLG